MNEGADLEGEILYTGVGVEPRSEVHRYDLVREYRFEPDSFAPIPSLGMSSANIEECFTEDSLTSCVTQYVLRRPDVFSATALHGFEGVRQVVSPVYLRGEALGIVRRELKHACIRKLAREAESEASLVTLRPESRTTSWKSVAVDPQHLVYRAETIAMESERIPSVLIGNYFVDKLFEPASCAETKRDVQSYRSLGELIFTPSRPVPRYATLLTVATTVLLGPAKQKPHLLPRYFAALSDAIGIVSRGQAGDEAAALSEVQALTDEFTGHGKRIRVPGARRKK